MREIKFRAWDKIAKKFLHPWPDGFHILGETTCFDMIGMQLKERNPEKTVLEMLNDVEIEEFTSRKDKAGKEIYQDDIVRKHHKNYNVNWNDKGFWELRRPSDWWLALHKVDSEKLEILGSIHTHPELMEKL